jgi:peptidoglycan/LPS O-acetylase OafA/YrhL
VWAAIVISVGAYCLLWPVNLVTHGFLENYEWATNLAMTPVFGLVIVAAASRNADGEQGFLDTRLMVKLGQWSFALYMVHALVLWAAEPAILKVHGALRPGVATAAVVLAVFVAGAVYEWYERPIEKRIRSWGKQRDSLIAQT